MERPKKSCCGGKDFFLNVDFRQGGEGEVLGQLSCIYETITTKILKKLKKIFIQFLELSDKNKF